MTKKEGERALLILDNPFPLSGECTHSNPDRCPSFTYVNSLCYAYHKLVTSRILNLTKTSLFKDVRLDGHVSAIDRIKTFMCCFLSDARPNCVPLACDGLPSGDSLRLDCRDLYE